MSYRDKKCKIKDCPNKIKGGGRGMCSKHYGRARKKGDPNWVNPATVHTEENKELIKSGKLRCGECNRVKGVHLYYKKIKNKLGYSSKCKACSSSTRKNQRKHFLRHTYDLTPEEYEILHEFNDEKCWICGGGSVKRLSVDHNHDNDKIRGLLCTMCNRMLGRWKDNAEIALAAYRYLKDDGRIVENLLDRETKVPYSEQDRDGSKDS